MATEKVSDRPNPVIIHDIENNKDYTLEFNRDSIKFAENRGFIFNQMENFPMTKLPEFFWYAFRMHHPSVSLKQAENLFDRMGGMSEALGVRLSELWAAPFNALTPEDGDEKNATVTMEL